MQLPKGSKANPTHAKEKILRNYKKGPQINCAHIQMKILCYWGMKQ